MKTSNLTLITLTMALCLMACESYSQQKEDPWSGVLSLSTKGDQEVEATFDFEKGNGSMSLPQIIPVPLRLSDVKQQGDSIFFSIGFRSGTAYCSATLKGDTIFGFMKKDRIPDSPFWLTQSGKKLSIFDRPKPPADQPIVIRTYSNSETEVNTKKRLEKVLAIYDLEPYLYTKEILIQDRVIPHSHPVLTISTRDSTLNLLLSTFVHEQMHWYSLSKSEPAQMAIQELKRMYPEVPVNLPEGSGSKKGTYLHLLVNYLEYHVLEQLIGTDQAREVIEYWSNHHYTWIYRTILDDEEKIRKVIKAQDLLFPTAL